MNREEAIKKITELQDFVRELDAIGPIDQWLESMSIPRYGYSRKSDYSAILKSGWGLYSWKPLPSPYTRFTAEAISDGTMLIRLSKS